MISFKDYVVIADALEAEQLEEGWMDNAILAIKKKLGNKMSDDEIADEIDKLKAKKGGADKKVEFGAKKVAQSQQSKDFHQRRADLAAAAEARQPKGTVGTQPNTAASFKSKSTSLMRGGELRALDRNPFGEGLVTEAQTEFSVEYVAKGGGSTKKCVIKGIDVTAVKEKFRRQYAGWKLLSAKPKTVRKPVPKKVEEVQEDQEHGPLGPRS